VVEIQGTPRLDQLQTNHAVQNLQAMLRQFDVQVLLTRMLGWRELSSLARQAEVFEENKGDLQQHMAVQRLKLYLNHFDTYFCSCAIVAWHESFRLARQAKSLFSSEVGLLSTAPACSISPAVMTTCCSLEGA